MEGGGVLIRLHSHLLANNALATAAEVVRHFGAMQAQDYLGALWAVGVRMREATERDVEAAVERRELVRCWPLRGTLHFVAAADARWMLELLAPRALERHRKRLERDFKLDRKTLQRCRTIAERALRGRALTRPELYDALERGGIATQNSRALHVIFALAHELVLCFGPRRGRQPTFVLFDEWVPPSPPRPRDDALAELARRYFTSHAPATIADFAWWSGLPAKEAKQAVALAAIEEHAPPRAPRKGLVHLLPPFDEYTVAYKDRSSILDPAHARKVNAGGGMLSAVLLIDGRVTGTWKRTLRGHDAGITVAPFRDLTAREERALEREKKRYAAFVSGNATA